MSGEFDYNFLKAMSRQQLLEVVPKEFSFYTEPWTHQIAAFLACISNDEFLLALDLGTGKTKVSIDICRYLHKNISPINGLVVCLNNAVEKWVDEINIHSYELQGIAVRGEAISEGKWWEGNSSIVKTAKECKMEALCSSDPQLRVISFESLRSLCSKRVKPSAGGKGIDLPDDAAIESFLSNVNPNIVIIDESHKVKNRETLIFDILNKIARRCRWRYLLTGTPFHNLLDLWAQYYIMDGGQTFGQSFNKFQWDYFEDKKRYIKSRGIYISNWVVTPSGKKAIMDKMYTRAIRYDEGEVHDMPGKVFEIRSFELSKEQKDDYLQIIKNFESNKTIKKFGENQTETFRQICSGFIIKTGKVYKHNPKLLLLEELIDEIIPHDKLVVFHHYQMEHVLISKLLRKKRINFTEINGGVKDKYANNKKFLTDERCRLALVSISSGSASIDLQSARYAIFFNNARSIIDRKQAIKRIHRGKIKRTRFYYDLIGNKTVERSAYNKLKSGVDLFDEVMDRKAFLDFVCGEL